jgi:hypothetical protein
MYILEKGLSYQRLILVVQKKLDCPVSETRLSGFRGFKPPGQNLPLHCFSHFSLSLSLTRTNVRVTLRPPLVIPWFLCGILELLGEINSPRNCVPVPPTGFPISRYFHLIIDLFAPWMDLKFLLCIVFINVIEQSPVISLSFLG